MSQPCCIVVGAGPGLGLTIARRFATGGFDIALISRSRDNLAAMTETLASEGHSARGFVGDAGKILELESTFAEIKEWNKNVGVLIYNAAIMLADSAPDITSAEMMKTMLVNLGGAMCAVNQVLPLMRNRSRGTILLTGGGLALEPYPNWTALGAGKAALRSYGISLHKALTPENIHVAVVAVCGIVEPGGSLSADLVAEKYWLLHEEVKAEWSRELVYLPEGSDAYYNDTKGVYRSTSLPIVSD